jgi:hypothetical protein
MPKELTLTIKASDIPAVKAYIKELEAAIRAKCAGCDDYWLCRTVDTHPDCPLYPFRGGE